MRRRTSMTLLFATGLSEIWNGNIYTFADVNSASQKPSSFSLKLYAKVLLDTFEAGGKVDLWAFFMWIL